MADLSHKEVSMVPACCSNAIEQKKIMQNAVLRSTLQVLPNP
jgi:hypothetical protein